MTLKKYIEILNAKLWKSLGTLGIALKKATLKRILKITVFSTFKHLLKSLKVLKQPSPSFNNPDIWNSLATSS